MSDWPPPGLTYTTIYADPPWSERGAGKCKRGADRHYPVLSTNAIIETMQAAPCWRPAENAHLWLWVTNNYLPDGLRVVEEMGFRYITNVVWVKEGAFGLGQYVRGKHELLLFAIRGRLPALTRSQGTVIWSPRGRHSEKPLSVYSLIESISPGPRLEMFARRERSGWHSWGNEVGQEVLPLAQGAASGGGLTIPEVRDVG
jgi:N6-adenosine-specific RNA methylase IME4